MFKVVSGAKIHNFEAFSSKMQLLTNLNFPGEWTPVFRLLRAVSGRIVPHQTWAKFRKNS